MSKIICDVCGTTYPETADQCPICGCAKPDNAQVVTNDVADQETSGTYTYVKGGRFSKANVAKRNKAMGIKPKQTENPAEQEAGNNRSSHGLVITLIVLILAIIAALIFIFATVFGGNNTGATEPSGTTETTNQVTTTASVPDEILCTDIALSETVISFDELGNAWLLNVTPTPADTTDEITFESADPTVATVTSEGRVTAIGAGRTTITVRCGEVAKTCTVICDIETVPTTEETTAEETEPEVNTNENDNEVYRTNKESSGNDVTIKVGESFNLFLRNSAGETVDVTWTSSKDGICTIEGNKITGAAPGMTTVSVERGGKQYSCIVRVTGKSTDDAVG